MRVVKISEVAKEHVVSPLFTGDQVFRQSILPGSDSTNFNFNVVSFGPGSHSKVHHHTSDQLLIVTAGTGVVANEREEWTITVGDVVLVPAGEDHWHGAPGKTAMTHIAITAKGCRTTILGESAEGALTVP